MSNLESSRWIVRTTGFQEAHFSDEIIACSKKDLTLVAFKKTAFFWMLALLCIFVPVLHFVLVPLLFVIGLFAFFQQTKNTHYIAEGTFICPNCEHQVVLKKFYFSNQKRFQCRHCNDQLVICQAT